MNDLRLEELSASTAVAANSLTLKPGQEQYLAPVSYSMSLAYMSPSAAWPRVVLDGDEVVGFIMGSFDPDTDKDELRSCIWRINVSADAQGRGIGRFAVHALADEARSRGFERLTVMYEPGDDGPEAFFLHIGFEVIGETDYGEHLAALSLAPGASAAEQSASDPVGA
ncbi:GNAT family N-acetyltransferase [Frondihabitans australicus]|uniref:Diamine N-acetyltransferase n=1 Tax=Frondihabitans australicus TaxID=386892 RepID=A0A495IJH5_9MICO|nr:GNAT family N-acetyltransferase [Frondihabitans australicus]RKR75441.1 diamine N-acetyltransferase [Frondihabitans australicus]